MGCNMPVYKEKYLTYRHTLELAEETFHVKRRGVFSKAEKVLYKKK